MPMIVNTFVAGYNLDAEFGAYATKLMQAIEKAVPESSYGIIFYDDSTPVITGDYAWRTRCLWLDTTVTSAPVLKAYRTTGSPGWFAIADAISNSTITTAMLQSGAVTLAKLSATGGTTAQLIRVNAGANGFEFVNASDIVGGLGSIAITALDNTAVGVTAELFVGCIGNTAGEVYWRDADDIAGLLSNAAVGPSKIGPATVLTTKTKFLSSKTGDTYGVYRVLDPDTDIDDGAINGDKLTDASVVGDKLSNLSISGSKLENATIDVTTKLVVPSSSALKILGVNTAGTAWELQTASTFVNSTLKRYSTAAADYGVFAVTTGHAIQTFTFAHLLGVAPTQVEVQLVCISPVGPYVAGDVFNAELLRGSPFGVDNAVRVTSNATSVIVIFTTVEGAGPQYPFKTPFGITLNIGPATAEFKVRVTASVSV